jgi:prevent-host-death family protein
MRYSTQIKPISDIKANAASVIEEIAETRNPVIITQNGRATAILQDIKSYEETQETLAFLQLLAMGREDIAKGRTRPARDVLAELQKKVDEA